MVLTELEIEGWTGAAVLAAKSGGGAPAARSALGLSGLLDGTARPKAVLREGYGGQGGSGATGGEKLQWRRCLPAAAVLAEGCGGAGGSGVELWGEDGEEKVAGPNYRRDPGISAGRSGIMIPANSPVISAMTL